MSQLYLGIKIQWQSGIATMMSTALLLLPHLLAFSQAAPEPDTHLHVHLPPEGGQGNFFLCFFFLMSFFQGKTPNTGAGGLATNGLK